MSPLLRWVAILAGIVLLEATIAFLLAGRGRRRATFEAAVWGNLTFEPVHALLGFAGGVWPAAGIVVVLLGETVVYETLTPLRAYEALTVALLANLVSSLAVAWLM